MPRWVRRADAAAARRINRRSAPDGLLTGLSRAADHGLLWGAIAATMVVFGAHRAALRGVGSMLVAGVVSDVVVKRFFDGPRPGWDAVPHSRRLRAYPTTTSFPSGHSASAAGFAAGVAWESPAAGAAVAPLAAGVAYSRLHVGAHWLSDVVAGVAIGAIVASLGRLVVPARRRAATPEPEVAQVVEPIALPVRADGDGVLIVMNRGAGTAVIHLDPRPVIAQRLPKARVRELEADEAMADVVAAIMAGEEAPDVLGVYGGDGSVSRMADLALEFDRPLLALPGGTFNHFARTAGLESVDRAIDALLAGEGIAASVGELRVGERTSTVLNSASIGVYPGFVAERTKRKAKLGKWLGGLVAAWRGLRDAEPIEISIGGRRALVWSVFASIGRNTPGQVATFQRRTLGRCARRACAARTRVAAPGGGGPVVRGGEPRGAAGAASLAAGVRHRAHHRARDHDLGAPEPGRCAVLRARRRAATPPGGRAGRSLRDDVPDPAARAARLRSRGTGVKARGDSALPGPPYGREVRFVPGLSRGSAPGAGGGARRMRLSRPRGRAPGRAPMSEPWPRSAQPATATSPTAWARGRGRSVRRS